MRSYNFVGMNGGLGLSPTIDGGFVGTGQHENGAGGNCDIYAYKLSRCGVIEWYKTYGSGGADGGKKIIQTSDGGYLINGLWNDGAGSGGGYEYALLKLDAFGNLQWNTVWNNASGNSGDYGLWVEEDSGGYITSGGTYGSPYANWNGILVFYNTVGTPTWARVFGGASEDVFGSVHSVLGGYIAGGKTSSFGAGGSDLCAVKVDPNGNPIWMYAYGGIGNEGRFWDTEGIPTPDGGYLLAGATDNLAWSQGGIDIFLVKLDVNGNIQWSKTYGGVSDEVAEGLAVSNDGYVITGYTYTNTNGGRDAFMLKIDTLGNFIWAKAYGTAGDDKGIDIVPVNNGTNGYALGMNRETAAGSGDFDPMLVRTDSNGICGCNTISSIYGSIDVTTFVTQTTIPLSASQNYLSNLSVSNPTPVIGSVSPNENLICSSCNNISASWQVNDTIVCNGDTIRFINTTTGPACYDWLFNGSVFTTNGDTAYIIADTANGYIQNMTLNIYCGNISTTLQQNIYISPFPNANFTAISKCEYDSIPFYDSTQTDLLFPIFAWGWDFGDNTLFNLDQNPTHLYSQDGIYNVTLGVVDIAGCTDTITKQIVVFDKPIAAYTTSNVCVYDSANFNSLSSVSLPYTLNQWNWDFGDGNTSNFQNPSHLYANFGTYAVNVVVISDSGCVDSISQNITIHPKPLASFTVNDDCVNIPANFTDISSVALGSLVTWNWNYGDGNISSLQNPSHLYATDGTFITSLIVNSDSGCTDTVSVTTIRYPIPVAFFTVQDVCLYDSAFYNDLSTVNTPDMISSWLWNFGDGSPVITNQFPSHLYNNYGNYSVSLIVVSNNGCVNDTVVPINIHPVPIANFVADTICVNTPPTIFTNQSSVAWNDIVNTWNWNFNNNQGSSTQEHPFFNFGNDGVFPVTLAVASNFGCWDTIVKPVKVYEKPTANFTADNLASCSPYCVNFTDNSSSSTTNMISWDWDFGNDETGLGNLASTCYNNHSNIQTQLFDVSLISENSYGCFDTITKNNFITVWPLPFADFLATPQPTDIYESEITFNNLSSIGITNWGWNFGDGGKDSINYSPVHLYADSGDYMVFLEVWNQFGCYDSTYKAIRIKPTYAIFIPNAFTPDGASGNETFFFKGYGISEEGFEFYIFDRWGEQIYFTNKFESWDGTYQNQPIQQGVYAYKFVCKDVNSIIHTYLGTVTLLK